MKKLFKKQNKEVDFNSISSILRSAACSIEIASYLGNNSKNGGVIVGVTF
jgi:hypothetical protein